MASGPSTYSEYIVGGLVREIWPDENLIEEVIEEEPVLGMCAKETDWGYAVRHHPLGWGANQGIGRTFADAKQYKSTTQEAEFQIATREMYAALSLEGKLLRTFEYTKKKALLVDPVTRAGELTIDRMRRRFSQAIHGDGVGVIGQISSSSSVSSATITLTDANDLKNFEQDRPIQVEANGTSGGTVSTEVAYVSSIGTEDTPTVTVMDSSGASITWAAAFPSVSVATTFRIYGAGTYDNDFIYGLAAYLPSHTGSPGTFLTCNRNRNPGWLAGRCMSGANLTVYQRIKKAARLSVDAGNKPDTYLLSTRNFEKLEFEFDNKLVMTKFPSAPVGKYNLGVEYTGVVVQGPRGPIKVLPSMWMPDTVERCGEMDSILMGSIGPLVHWDMGNGMGSMSSMRTEDGTDNRELRAVSDPAFLVKKPGAWIRVATT
jgi:hypothetical protein